MKIFGRDPAIWLAVINAGIGLVVALHWLGLTTMQGGALVTVVSAILGLATAFYVKPFAPTAATYLVGVVFEALSTFQYHVSAQAVASINLLILAMVAAIVRPQSTPAADPVAAGGVTKADVPQARLERVPS